MTVNINASTNSKRIPIGRCEDNEATRVVFDCSGFSSAYGSGQATLLHRRSKEKISYIVQNVAQTGNTVTWTVSSDDTAFSGEGTLQLMWTVNDVVVHSHFYTTITDPSLTDSSSEPTEVKSALQLLIDSCYTKEETDDLIAHMRAGSDWDANEGESGYIENRPFYEEKIPTLVVNGDIHKFDQTSYYAIKSNNASVEYQLADDTTYIVEVNGSRYKCTAHYSDLSGYLYMGRGKRCGYPEDEDLSYPFTILNMGENPVLYASYDEETENNTLPIKIYLESGEIVIHKLDSKFVDGKFITSGTGENSEIFNDITNNIASYPYAHAEGRNTSAINVAAHAENYNNTASGPYSHCEGGTNVSSGPYSHCEGYQNIGSGQACHVEGDSNRATAAYSHVENYNNNASGVGSHSEGIDTKAKKSGSHSEGNGTIGDGEFCHVEGIGSNNSIKYTGTNNYRNPGAYASAAHVEGIMSRGEGQGCHSEGYECLSLAEYSHSEGVQTSALNRGSHSEGQLTTANAEACHAEGYLCNSNGPHSHTEGNSCNTTIYAEAAHAEGIHTESRGQGSHSEGIYTVATADASHVVGKYNVIDDNEDYVEIVGNGTEANYRSNARTLDWNGNESLAGSLTLGMGTADEVTITAAQLTQLLALLSS